jgi:chitodextrinase
MLSVPTSPSTVEVRSAGKASPKRRSAVGWIAALTSALLVAGPLASAPPAYAASVPSMVALGTAETFSALAGSYVTLATTSTVNGDVGAGAAITAGPGSVGGSQHPNNDAVDQKAQADLTTAYNDAEGRAPIAPDIAGELGGQTLTTGVYHSTAAFTLTGTLKLDGGGNPNAVFIFQTPAAMTLAASAKVALIGGAQASHVYWQIASYVTLGAQAQFAGTILSDSYISFGAGASLAGRALSRTGYVTLDAGSITSQRVAPVAPASVSATAGNASATVSWPAPVSNGGSTVTGYTITPSPACAGCSGLTTTGLSTTVTGLTNGTTYTFTVTATNAEGTSAPSAASNPVTPSGPATAPSAPTAVSATAGNAQALVTWTAPSSSGGSPITGYTITPSPACSSCSGLTTTGLSTTVTGLTNGTSYTFTVTATNAVGTSSSSAPSNSVTPSTGMATGTGAGFTGVNPTRVLDTRYGTGAPQAKLGTGQVLTLTIPNLPSGTTAVALNVTVTNPTADSYLTVYPAGGTRPVASNLNFERGQTIPNMVLVPVGPGNTVTFYNLAGDVDVIADLLGYYAPGTGAGFTGVNPIRVLRWLAADGSRTQGFRCGTLAGVGASSEIVVLPWLRKSVAARTPESKSCCCSAVLMSKSIELTLAVSTNTVRLVTCSSSRWYRSQPASNVRRHDMARSKSLPAGWSTCAEEGRPDSFTPHVGHLPGLPSVRSKAVIGKLLSIPPSTQLTFPVGVLNVTGRKKNGMLMLARTASTTRIAAGSCP